MKMKLHLTASFAFLTIVSVVVGSSDANIRPDTIAGLWLFDEGTGKKAKDASENKNDGTIVGKFKWVDGKFGSALEFDGQSAWLEVPSDKSLDLTDGLTIAFWAQPQRIPGGDERIMAKGMAGNIEVNYQMYIRGRHAMFEFNSGAWWKGYNPNGVILEAGEWYHICGTYDGNVALVYVNAVVDNPGGIGEDNPFGKGVVLLPNTAPLFIGKDDRKGFFTGILDEFLILNVALTEPEVKQVMEEGLVKSMSVEFSGKAATTWGRIKKASELVRK